MWPSRGLLEVEAHREYGSGQNSTATYRAASDFVASERARLLAAVRSTVNAVLMQGLTESDCTSGAGPVTLACTAPVVRDLCVAVEESLIHHLVPSIFALSNPTLWRALSLLQLAGRRRGDHGAAAGESVHLAAEAVALARILCEKHLSLLGPLVEMPASVKDAYAARLWLCLGLQRRVLPDWVGAIAHALPHAYANGSLLMTPDECGVLIDTLDPLEKISFALPPRPPRKLGIFLGLPSSEVSPIGPSDEFLPPDGDAVPASPPLDDVTDTPEELAPATAHGGDHGGAATDEQSESVQQSDVVPTVAASATDPISSASTSRTLHETVVPLTPASESRGTCAPRSSRGSHGRRTGRRTAPIAAPIMEPTAAPTAAAKLGAAAAAAAEAFVTAAPVSVCADTSLADDAELESLAYLMLNPAPTPVAKGDEELARVVGGPPDELDVAAEEEVEEAPHADHAAGGMAEQDATEPMEQSLASPGNVAIAGGDEEVFEGMKALDTTQAVAAAPAAPASAPQVVEQVHDQVHDDWPFWPSIERLLVSAEYTSKDAVRFRQEAAAAGVPWHDVLRAADAVVAESQGTAPPATTARRRGDCGTGDRLALFVDDATSPSHSEEEPPACLRQVSRRDGAHLLIGVSGVLSSNEGDMAAEKQPMTLANVWSTSAAYFGVADWWSLSWGGKSLAALAAELNDPSSSFSAADESGRNGGGGASATTAIAQALSPVRAHWSASYEAAKKAGAALAAQLRARRCGERPVTLIGVSLGARVVWHCLEVLADLPDTDGTGLVLDVLLIAAPVTANPGRWEKISTIVAGRLINAYVPGDTQLGVLYRIDHLTSKGCCGLSAVPSTHVENFDVTDQVHVAQDSRSYMYHFAVPFVLARADIGLLHSGENDFVPR